MSALVARHEHIAVPGFESARVAGALLVARPEAMSWARDALRRRGSLHVAALDHATVRLQGRGPTPVMPDPVGAGPDWVVRHYRRGGGMRFLHDRFLRLGRPRCLRELESSVRVRELGITTPRVVVAALYPAGLFYRADLVTELVYDARELADLLLGTADASAGPVDADTRATALEGVDRLVALMAEKGVRHADLNARNILLAPTAGGLESILLDLDRCVIGEPLALEDERRLRRRLARSIRKLQRSRVGEMSVDDMEILLKGAKKS